jgi:arginase family enzyme
LRALAGLSVVGLDLVEVCPPYDPSGITAILAARLIRDCLLLF